MKITSKSLQKLIVPFGCSNISPNTIKQRKTTSNPHPKFLNLRISDKKPFIWNLELFSTSTISFATKILSNEGILKINREIRLKKDIQIKITFYIS